MPIKVDNGYASASLLLAGKSATIAGTASHGKRSAGFVFNDVAPDPRKGDDALAIVLLLASMDDDRAAAIADAVAAAGDPVTMDACMEAGMDYPDAKEAVSDYRTRMASVRKDAGKRFDESDNGKVRLDLLDTYRTSKRATFRVPGSEAYATLSAVIGKVTGGKVAAGFAKARNAKRA